MLSRDCRHRLGSTVGGAFSSERKPYGSRLQTTLPCADVIRAFSSVPRKPRDASSKSRVSENGSAFSVAACCATTDAEASLGTSPVPWVIELFSPAVASHGQPGWLRAPPSTRPYTKMSARTRCKVLDASASPAGIKAWRSSMPAKPDESGLREADDSRQSVWDDVAMRRFRHGRACSGHPRLPAKLLKTWMPGTSPGMTNYALLRQQSLHFLTLLASILIDGSSSFVVNAVSTANGFSMPR